MLSQSARGINNTYSGTHCECNSVRFARSLERNTNGRVHSIAPKRAFCAMTYPPNPRTHKIDYLDVEAVLYYARPILSHDHLSYAAARREDTVIATRMATIGRGGVRHAHAFT